MSWCFAEECVRTFFTVYKFPIAISGLSLPLVAMVAAIHRSMEAAHQLNEALLNNRFGNYLKHREGFEKLLDGFCERENKGLERGLLVMAQKIYAELFPDSGFNNKSWNGRHDSGYLGKLDEHVEVVMSGAARGSSGFDFSCFLDSVSYLSREMHISYSPYSWVRLAGNDVSSGNRFVVSSLLAEKYAFVIAVSDILEVYMLLKIYAGEYGGRDIARDFIDSDVFKSVIFSSDEYIIKSGPDWKNG